MMDPMHEGFYPPGDLPAHPEVEPCRAAEAHESHEPHFWVPSFYREDEYPPDFVCGGWPTKIHDINEAR